MKPPRFGLRTVFVVLTLFGVVLGWIAYHLNWIRLRHALIENPENATELAAPGFSDPPANWPLSWFGETTPNSIYVPADKLARAKELFPEAKVEVMPEGGFREVIPGGGP